MPRKNHYILKNGQMITGEPRRGSTIEPSLFLWGEDPVHNRMNVTISDWHTMSAEGWRLRSDVKKKEVKRAIVMLQEIYSRMK